MMRMPPARPKGKVFGHSFLHPLDIVTYDAELHHEGRIVGTTIIAVSALRKCSTSDGVAV